MAVRHITRDTKAAAAEHLAAAFSDDPLMRWVFASDPESASAHTALWMKCEVDAALGLGHAYIDEAGSGAALWSPPEQYFYGDELSAEIFALVEKMEPERAELVAEGLMAIGEHLPDSTCFYLAVIGVAPQGRGQGVGRRLLERVLNVCDEEGVDAYLESSNPRNVGLYERNGFEVIAEVEMPENGPIIRPMHRTPR